MLLSEEMTVVIRQGEVRLVFVLLALIVVVKLFDRLWSGERKPAEPPEGFDLGLYEKVWAPFAGDLVKATIVGHGKDNYIVNLGWLRGTRYESKSSVSRRHQ